MEDAFLDQLPSFSPDNQVTLLSALLDLGHTPGTVFLDALCAACQPQLLTLRSPELVALLTRLGKLKYQPETEWLARLVMNVCGGASSVGIERGKEALPASCPCCTSVPLLQRLHCIAAAAANLHLSRIPPLALPIIPPPHIPASFLSVLHYHLPLLEASSFASVVHSLSLMEAQVSSDEWWSIFCHTMRPRLAAMKKEDLLTMVVALPV